MATLSSIVNKHYQIKGLKKNIEKDLDLSDDETLIYDVAKIGTIQVDNESIDNQLNVKEYKIRQLVHYLLQKNIFDQIKKKLPRSNFAGIKDIKYRPKRTNRLRNSLEFKTLGFGKYKYELDGSILKYPDIINQDTNFITYKYWDKIYEFVYEDLFKRLKNQEKILNIKVKKG